MQFRKVEFWQQVKAPTLNQYLWRRYMASVTKGKGGNGVVTDPESGNPLPLTAFNAKQQLRGITAQQVAIQHPEWVEDYKKEYRKGGE